MPSPPARRRELVWLLEHPPLYTAGTSAKAGRPARAGPLSRARTGRGGQFTYHGPGQRVGYVMLDVRRRFGDVRAYVAALEDVLIIDALAQLGVEGETLARPRRRLGAAAEAERERHDKIAAIGVRLRRWVSSHGFSLNVAPDLDALRRHRAVRHPR